MREAALGKSCKQNLIVDYALAPIAGGDVLRIILDHQQFQKSRRDFQLFFTFLRTEIQKS